MTVSQHVGGPSGKTVTMDAEQVLIEARRRVTVARDIVARDGDAALAADLDELAEELSLDEYVPDRDRGELYAFAALMGVTVREQ